VLFVSSVVKPFSGGGKNFTTENTEVTEKDGMLTLVT
jgi:hypothetical protein